MSIELIATTIKTIDDRCPAVVDNTVVIATPTLGPIAALGGSNEGLIRNLITAARNTCVAADGSIIAGAASKLKKMGVVLHTVKMTGYTGNINVLVYFWTSQGIIVIYQSPSVEILKGMVNWGIPPKVEYVDKEKVVEKVVEKIVEVPAAIPKGFFARLKFLFS